MINPETQYAGKITPASAGYPYGSARNITTPGDGTGTPWEAALLNDIFGSQQALLSEAGVVPSGTPDQVGASQWLQSLFKSSGLVKDDYTKLRLVESTQLSDVTSCLISNDLISGFFTLDKTDITSVDNNGTIIVDADGGRWHRRYSGDLESTWFGVVADGSTGDSVALQAAIDYVESTGGGVVLLPVGVAVADFTVILPSTVVLKGQGHAVSILKAANGLNADIIQTKNFTTLTGTNKWMTIDGVQYGFGIIGIQIDGNKANQTAGRGVSIYGKQYTVDDLLIRDTFGDGYYSEAGDTGGQTDWTDMPECNIGQMWIKECDGNGMVYRGPHDGHIDKILIAESGLKGLLVQRSPGVYNGVADFNFVHSYANADNSIDVNCRIKAEHLIGEAGYKTGVVLQSTSTDSQINKIEAYGNDRNNLSTFHEVEIIGSANLIDQIFVATQNSSLSGLTISGENNKIGKVNLNGVQTAGLNITGLVVNANGTEILAGYINGYATAGSTGLKTNLGGARSFCNVNVHIRNCETLWNNITAGAYNTYGVVLQTLALQTPFAGAQPNANKTETWNSYGVDNVGGILLSKNKITAAGFAVDTVGLKTVTVNHNMLTTPRIDDIQLTEVISTGVNDYGLRYVRVNGVTATQVTVAVYVDVASATALATVDVNVDISL